MSRLSLRARGLGLLLPLPLLVGMAACGDSASSTPPSATTITDTFSGTVQVGGSDSHDFTVMNSSEVDVTLTAATPPDGIVMGVGVGSGSPCAIFAQASVKTAAGTSVQLAGGLSPGTFCVSVFDVSNQTQPVTYSVTVTHK